MSRGRARGRRWQFLAGVLLAGCTGTVGVTRARAPAVHRSVRELIGSLSARSVRGRAVALGIARDAIPPAAV
jgi:hypothetical protein